MLLVKMLRSTSTAIVLFLLGGAALFSLPTTFAASIKTYPGFLSADEIKQFTSVDVDKAGIWYTANKGRDAAALDRAISIRLHHVTGTAMTAEEQRQYRRSIPVTKMTGTTKVHVDRHHDSGEPVDGKVAFIMLNDNADAVFVHGSTEVPAKAGKLVVFDASVPHNTQIARGTLSLAGPVDLRRLTPVGSAGCNDDCDCIDINSGATPICSCDSSSCNTCPTERRLTTSDDGNTEQRQLQKLQFLRKLDEVHEREISAEEQERRLECLSRRLATAAEGHEPESDADLSNRRLATQCPCSCGVRIAASSSKSSKAKSSKAPKGSKSSKGEPDISF